MGQPKSMIAGDCGADRQIARPYEHEPHQQGSDERDRLGAHRQAAVFQLEEGRRECECPRHAAAN